MMKNKKSIFIAFLLMLIASIVYRIFPNRPVGFAPQFAIGLLAGAMVGRKAWAFALPLLSMFISDIFYQVLYKTGYSNTPGFYEYQWVYYILFTSLTVFGFTIKNYKISSIVVSAIIAPTAYFILSNAVVWLTGWGYKRATLLECYNDGIPFYENSLIATIIFSTLFFGIMYWLTKPVTEKAVIITKP